jgi:hypothetical protein
MVRSTAEFTEYLFVRDAVAAFERRACALDITDCFGSEVFVFDGGFGERLREWLDEHVQQSIHGGEFVLRESIDQQMSVAALLGEIEFHWLILLKPV